MEKSKSMGNLLSQLHSKLGQLGKSAEIVEFLETVSDTYRHYELEIERLKTELDISATKKTVSVKNSLLNADSNVVNERFELFLKATNDAVYDWDMVSDEITWSDGFERLYGKKMGDFIFNFETWSQHVHPDDLNRVLHSIQQVVEKKDDCWSDNYRFRCADDSYKNINERGYIIYEEGKATRMVGVMQDVTERTVAQTDLKKEVEFTENLIRQANVMIIGVDLMGDIFIFNNEAEKVTGYSKEEVIGRPFSQFIQNSDDYSLISNHLSQFQHFGNVRKVTETSLFSKTGNKIIISWQNSEIYNEGKLVGSLSFGIDVTEKHRKDEQLIDQNVALQKANNELDQFVYRASHDMKAPLTSVLGLVNIIRDETTDENIKPYLCLVEKSVENLMSYIRNIIDYSKNHNQILYFSNISFNKLINNAILQNKSADISNVKVYYELQQECKFYSDETRLSLIINNLLSNAVKYSKNVQDSFVKVKVIAKPAGVTITVEDNGKGIKNIFHDKIFCMFFRGSTEKQGSGLGLYIVREALSLLNGSISFTSEENEGAIFTVNLPHFARSVN